MTDRYILVDANIAPFAIEEGNEYCAPGVIAIDGAKIGFVGALQDLPSSYVDAPQTSLDGRLVTPGLIDCHTHLIHAGSRAREFEMRQLGVSYEDIMLAGGGIFSTVEATRAASDEELLDGASTRLDRLISEGVTTVEIKSGYGLDRETELKMLRVARSLEKHRSIRICTSFLGAHACPKDMAADDYLTDICLPTLQEAANEGLVDAVDVFCETVGFNIAQTNRVFEAAQELGLPIKIHAEQLSDQGGATLAAGYQALSADHLEYLSVDGVTAMAKADMVAVLLPGAFYNLKETKRPPVEQLRDAGVSIAVATDSNPGSAPMSSLLLAMNMGANLFGLTPQECLEGATVNAAKALGLKDVGKIEACMCADLAVWDFTDPAELTYRIGDAPLHKRIFGGVVC